MRAKSSLVGGTSESRYSLWLCEDSAESFEACERGLTGSDSRELELFGLWWEVVGRDDGGVAAADDVAMVFRAGVRWFINSNSVV